MTGRSALLKKLAGNPWVLSCASFVLTALLIRSTSVALF